MDHRQNGKGTISSLLSDAISLIENAGPKSHARVLVRIAKSMLKKSNEGFDLATSKMSENQKDVCALAIRFSQLPENLQLRAHRELWDMKRILEVVKERT